MEAAAPSSGAHGGDAYEMSHRLVLEVRQGNRAAVARLLSRGNSTNRPVRDADGRLYPLLYVASEFGHADVVILLLDHEAAIDARSPEGTTALLIASEHNHLAVVRCLLDRRASVNLSNIRGYTPLFAASHRG
jgi:ankyrin repeat protein